MSFRLLLLLFLTGWWSCNTPAVNRDENFLVKGVYGNPAALWKAGYDFPELGINAVFIRSGSLDSAFMERAAKEGVKVFVEFPVLNGKSYLEKYPEAWPVTEKGERAEQADWFMGICPTDTGFQSNRINALRELLGNYSVDGIFLDYFHWHAQFESAAPILPETCFCDRCIQQFQYYLGRSIPVVKQSERAAWILQQEDAAWRKWRSRVLLEWADRLNAVIKSADSTLLTGIFHCGWYPADFDSSLYRHLGIDLEALATKADVLSPMLFHQLSGRPVSWVGEYPDWLGKQDWMKDSRAPLIWPIVQGYDGSGKVSAAEFRQVLELGAQLPAGGVMLFSAESIAADAEKIAVLKEVYLK